MTSPVSLPGVASLAGRPIRAVVFDAVGTVIYAMPSVTAAYCEILGSLCHQPIDERFVRSVLSRRLVTRSSDSNLTTDEESERTFWFDLIAELVPNPSLQQECFEQLYEHFSRPENWRCYDDVSDAFRTLKDMHLQVVIASNFDQRLHSVCAGLKDLEAVSDRIISSEVGWRKPARQFFDIVCERTDCRPDEILFVGDDPQNDIHGARLAGMPAAWIDRRGEPTGAVDPAIPPNRTDHVWKIGSLKELATLIPSMPQTTSAL